MAFLLVVCFLLFKLCGFVVSLFRYFVVSLFVVCCSLCVLCSSSFGLICCLLIFVDCCLCSLFVFVVRVCCL